MDDGLIEMGRAEGALSRAGRDLVRVRACGCERGDERLWTRQGNLRVVGAACDDLGSLGVRRESGKGSFSLVPQL